MKRILYLNHVSKMGGGEHCLLHLIKNIDRNRFTPVLALQEPGPLSEKAKSLGIEVFFIDMPGWRKISKLFRRIFFSLPRLVSLVREKNIDLVHCNAYRLTPYGVAAAKAGNIKCVSHIRWFTEKSHIWKFHLDQADVVIAMSDYMKSFFNGSSAKVKTVYDGIDVAACSWDENKRRKIRGEFKVKPEAFVVGMVAQLTLRKGHHDFLQAAALIQKVFPETVFFLVGGDILDKQLKIKDLEKLSGQLGLKNIIFTGHRDDSIDFFSAFDCFVLPSHIEPFGLVVLEAMAAGTPVVATRSGGPQEIIKNGETGFLVGIKSPQELAARVLELIKDKNLALGISLAAKRSISESFDAKKAVLRIEEIYDQLLN